MGSRRRRVGRADDAAAAPFDIHAAGMLALDVARVEAGLLLIDVDFNSSKKALIESQKYTPFEMGLGRLVQLDTRPFVGRARAARGTSPRPGAADRRPRHQLAGGRSALRHARSGAADLRRRVARRRARLPGRPPGRPRDDDHVVAGAEEADRAGDGRGAAHRARHRRSSSRSPSKRSATASRRRSSRRRSSTRREKPRRSRNPHGAASKKIAPGGGTESAEAGALRATCRRISTAGSRRSTRLYAAFAGARLRGYLLSQCRDAALADDLSQETFMQIHRSRRTYEPGRPVTPWVFAIARHVYLMNRRATARRLRFEATAPSSESPI